MKEETKKVIEELKALVLQLHRSASNLDQIIDMIEKGFDNHNEQYNELFIKCNFTTREDYKKTVFFDLDSVEDSLWKKLIETVKTEG